MLQPSEALEGEKKHMQEVLGPHCLKCKIIRSILLLSQQVLEQKEHCHKWRLTSYLPDRRLTPDCIWTHEKFANGELGHGSSSHPASFFWLLLEVTSTPNIDSG